MKIFLCFNDMILKKKALIHKTSDIGLFLKGILTLLYGTRTKPLIVKSKPSPKSLSYCNEGLSVHVKKLDLESCLIDLH